MPSMQEPFAAQPTSVAGSSPRADAAVMHATRCHICLDLKDGGRRLLRTVFVMLACPLARGSLYILFFL